jgi:hypothetical protein
LHCWKHWIRHEILATGINLQSNVEEDIDMVEKQWQGTTKQTISYIKLGRILFQFLRERIIFIMSILFQKKELQEESIIVKCEICVA